MRRRLFTIAELLTRECYVLWFDVRTPDARHLSKDGSLKLLGASGTTYSNKDTFERLLSGAVVASLLVTVRTGAPTCAA